MLDYFVPLLQQVFLISSKMVQQNYKQMVTRAPIIVHSKQSKFISPQQAI